MLVCSFFNRRTKRSSELNKKKKEKWSHFGRVNAGIEKPSLSFCHVFLNPPTVLEVDGFPFITLDKDTVGGHGQQWDSFYSAYLQ